MAAFVINAMAKRYFEQQIFLTFSEQVKTRKNVKVGVVEMELETLNNYNPNLYRSSLNLTHEHIFLLSFLSQTWLFKQLP